VGCRDKDKTTRLGAGQPHTYSDFSKLHLDTIPWGSAFWASQPLSFFCMSGAGGRGVLVSEGSDRWYWPSEKWYIWLCVPTGA
jgi:hypothetical protein